jgi:hypothetical protein
MGLAPRNWESVMTIREIVTQAFHYARTCRSLWLFGFFVGIASGGSNGGGGRAGGHGGAGGEAVGSGLPVLSVTEIALIASAVLILIAAFVVMRVIAEGALIEGIVRVRKGGTMTTGEGFRAGWAHWGVLFRIALLYLAATIGSVALLAAPCVIAFPAFGPLAAILLGILAVVIAVPWLVTLYLVQAFAWRIAVIENRHALDAIGKARLFLHGRLIHGLKLIVAMFIGTLGIMLLGVVVIAPVALLLVASIWVLPVTPVMVLACLLLLPVIYVFAAVLGTFRSAIWTLGYVTQVES